MFRVLIDTCVWLDMAKDYQQRTTLTALEELIQQGDIQLILPRIIVDEFVRNKERVIEESKRSLSGTFKRVKEVIERIGDPAQRQIVLTELNDVNQRIPTLGESAIEAISRIEKIFSNTPIIETSDSVKIRAAQRAIDKRAPFHRQRNGIDDAILIEAYSDEVNKINLNRTRFIFISHNTKDFSHQNESNKLPHPDMEECFSKNKSFYFINLNEALHLISPDYFDEFIDELEFIDEPRKVSEIIAAIDVITTKVWYNRHQVMKEKIDKGIITIVDKEIFPIRNNCTRPIQRNIWESALKAAAEVEKELGLEELGPWDDFEWGMMNGKLSALRWVLSEEWDMLDT